MSVTEELIPPPPVLREKLAQHVREGRTLRALLRLSVRAAEASQRPSSKPSIEPNQPAGVRA